MLHLGRNGDDVRCVEGATGVERRVRELLAAGDDRGAATVALRALGPRIRRYLRAVLRDDDDAEDASSLFAESLWKCLPRFRGDSSLETWAFAIAVHAGMRVRDEAGRRRVRRITTGEASALMDEIRTSSKVTDEQQRRCLDDLRAALTDDDRTLLALRVDQRLAWANVAEIMTAAGRPVTVAALCKRFERLTARLQRMARELGLLDTTSARTGR
jgi:RNA polymerase sigma-70 factor, ECF subfamily